MEQTNIEPDGGIERTVLVQAQPGELFVVSFTVRLAGEVAVLNSPVSDCTSDSVNDLLNAGFTFGSTGLAIKILADNNIRGQSTPVLRNQAVLLLKQDAAVLVLDMCCTRLPLDCIERVNVFRAEMRLDLHRAGLGNDRSIVPILGFEIILEESLVAVHRALSLVNYHTKSMN